MILKNTEKQLLQKHYAERIKSVAVGLKDVIQQDRQDVLASRILDIKDASTRICQLQNEWRADSQHKLAELEKEVEDGYKEKR